jgi:hypothetical protein
VTARVHAVWSLQARVNYGAAIAGSETTHEQSEKIAAHRERIQENQLQCAARLVELVRPDTWDS